MIEGFVPSGGVSEGSSITGLAFIYVLVNKT